MPPAPMFALFNTGTSGAATPAEANRIRLINTVGIIPLLFYFPCTLYCIYGHYYRIIYTNLFVFIAVGLALFLNSRYKYSAAKALIICTHSLTVFVYYKLMMDEHSMFFFYFPITLTCILFYCPEKERGVLIFTLFFLALCIACALFVPYQLFKPFPLPAALHAAVYVIDAFICIGLTAYYVYKMFITNIRNEKLLTEAKRGAEQAAHAKTLFLSSMSHELRTPLNGIIGLTEILKTERYLPEQEHHLSVMANLSEHMLGLVNNVLDFSKIDAGKLELQSNRFNAAAFLQKIEAGFKNLFDDKDVSLSFDVDNRLAEFDLFADELRLQQVLNNLLSNALKFTEPKGAVTLSAQLLFRENSRASCAFSVSDTGIGIAPGHLRTIFESFSQGDAATTRKYGGSGLGLSISESLVKKFGGTIAVQSEQGLGSRFSFTIALPFFQQEAEVEAQPTASPESLQGLRVLMAEDNKVNMFIVKRHMEKWGILLTEAENGLIAFEKCLDQDFDLIFLDLEMPVMGGMEAVKKINNLKKGVPVVAFTAGVYENMETSLLAAGFTDYVLKPFVPELLQRRIMEVKKGAVAKEVAVS